MKTCIVTIAPQEPKVSIPRAFLVDDSDSCLLIDLLIYESGFFREIVRKYHAAWSLVDKNP